MPKWFKQSDDEDSDSDSSTTTTSSSGSTSDSSSSSSDSSSQSASTESGGGLNKWMKKDDDGGNQAGDKRKSKSRQDKGRELLLKKHREMKELLNNNDFGKLIDHVDVIKKSHVRLPGSNFGIQGPPAAFIGILKMLVDFFASEEARAVSKGLSKQQRSYFTKLKKSITALQNDFESDLANYESDEETESSSSGSSLHEEDSDDDRKNRRKTPKKTKKKMPTPAEKEKQEKEKDEWTPEDIERKLDAIKAERGKKVTKNDALLERINDCLAHSGEWRHMTLYVLSVLLSCQMDGTTLAAGMSIKLWKDCYDTLTRMLNIVQDNPSIIAVDQEEAFEEEKRGVDRRTAAVEHDAKTGNYRVYLTCTFHQVVDRLGDEYIKALQTHDHNASEYVERLAYEGYLIDISERAYTYYKSMRQKQEVTSRMALRLMDHLYYRRKEDHILMTEKQRLITFNKAAAVVPIPAEPEPESQDEDSESEVEVKRSAEEEKKAAEIKEKAESLAQELDERTKKPKSWVVTNDLALVMKNLHRYVQKHGDDRSKTKALFCFIYHLAVHDEYNKARDLLTMSRKQAENEEHMRFVNHPPLMIMYNRVIAQLGLAAFRAGEMMDTLMILNEICAQSRIKEYLAQSVVRNRDKGGDFEKEDKGKLIPFHMQINVDMLDAVHLIAAMLHEVPTRAQSPHDTKRRAHSKAFHKLLQTFTQQVFLGPPETTKEVIYASFLSLQKGDWKAAHDRIMGLSFWKLIRGEERVKAMLTEQIKLVGLRTYLFTFSQYYATVQLGELAVKYQLEESKVHATISKMILRLQITAAWDQPQQCICVEQISTTKLQFLALQMADKCITLVEYNEGRQTEKERLGKDDRYPLGGYMNRRNRLGGKWENRGNAHLRGLQKSREIEKEKKNPFERKTWANKNK